MKSKRELRQEAIARRSALVAQIDTAAAARQIQQRFLDLFDPPTGIVVSAFWPMGDELDLRSLIAALHARGCVCALPVVTAKRSPLTFRSWEPGITLVQSAFGIAEPGKERPVVTPDISIVPLLAFDAAGFRLGYGGGYYDRTIEQLRRTRRAGPYLAVGAAFAGQQVDELPHDAFDQRLDWIVTEDGIAGRGLKGSALQAEEKPTEQGADDRHRKPPRKEAVE